MMASVPSSVCLDSGGLDVSGCVPGGGETFEVGEMALGTYLNEEPRGKW